MQFLDAEGVEAQVLAKVIEVAEEQHLKFIDNLLDNLTIVVQNGTARAFGGK